MPMASASSDPAARADRDALLARIVEALKADVRVIATWLAGSLGAGRADDLSDIDIWIAVSDDAITAIAADPVAFSQELTKPVHAFAVPANAPPGGAYLFSIVDTGDSLQQVDWYWIPAYAASRQPNTLVLFERAPVPLQPPSPDMDAFSLDEFLLHSAREALAGAFIAVKQVHRRDHWAFSRNIQYVAQFTADLTWAIEHRRIPVHDDHVDPGLPGTVPVNAADQRSMLLLLLERLAPHWDVLPLDQRSSLDHALRAIRSHIRRNLSDDA